MEAMLISPSCILIAKCENPLITYQDSECYCSGNDGCDCVKKCRKTRRYPQLKQKRTYRTNLAATQTVATSFQAAE